MTPYTTCRCSGRFVLRNQSFLGSPLCFSPASCTLRCLRTAMQFRGGTRAERKHWCRWTSKIVGSSLGVQEKLYIKPRVTASTVRTKYRSRRCFMHLHPHTAQGAITQRWIPFYTLAFAFQTEEVWCAQFQECYFLRIKAWRLCCTSPLRLQCSDPWQQRTDY